jgi:hypothetical protein
LTSPLHYLLIKEDSSSPLLKERGGRHSDYRSDDGGEVEKMQNEMFDLII